MSTFKDPSSSKCFPGEKKNNRMDWFRRKKFSFMPLFDFSNSKVN